MSAVKLTAEQRRRVRELMTDEGESRASAIAWVLAMEPSPPNERPAGRVALNLEASR